MSIHKDSIHLEGALRGDTSLAIWRRHLRRHWLRYSIGVVSVIATNVTDVMVPKLIQWTIDGLEQRDAAALRTVGGLIALLVLQAVGRIYWRQTLGQQTHYVAARLKSLLWDRARYFPRRRLETDLSPGELMSVATSDVGTGRLMFGFTIVGTVDFVFLLVLSIAAMLTIDVTLTLTTLVLLPIVPFLLHPIAERENRQHRDAQNSLSHLTDLAAQAVATQRLQRVSRTHSFWESKLREAARVFGGKRLDVVRTSLAFIPITGIAPLVSFAILLALGLPKVLDGKISVGAFVALQSYIFLIQQPMLELGTIISEWQRSMASFDRVTATLSQSEAEGLRTGGVDVSAHAVTFETRRLSFRYPGNDRAVLRDVSFSLGSGRRLGITGPIGTGKTTLLEILSGLTRDFDGDLLLFGRDVRTYSHEALRRWIAVVPQKPFLFSDTVRANITVDRPMTDDEVWRWLDIAGVKEDIEKLPKQLDARLGEWGVNLSGGQKQRLTLARALARRPRILLLDDCLSAVDTVTEEKILGALDRELKDATLVWVAHRASTLRHCTDFLELKGGADHELRA